MAVLMREAIGASLRRARTARRRTLRDVSRRARVSLGYLSEVERGRKEPSSELLAAICEALDVALPDLLDRGGRGARRPDAPRPRPAPAPVGLRHMDLRLAGPDTALLGAPPAAVRSVRAVRWPRRRCAARSRRASAAPQPVRRTSVGRHGAASAGRDVGAAARAELPRPLCRSSAPPVASACSPGRPDGRPPGRSPISSASVEAGPRPVPRWGNDQQARRSARRPVAAAVSHSEVGGAMANGSRRPGST